MKQLGEVKVNTETLLFEQEFEASDGCKVILDVEKLEDDWALHAKDGQTCKDFKEERLKELDAHPHTLSAQASK